MIDNDVIRYNHGAIDGYATEVSGVAKNLRESLDHLEKSVDKLKNVWSGQAATEYRVYQDQWTSSSAAIQSLLAQLAGIVSTGNEGTAMADKKAAGSWPL